MLQVGHCVLYLVHGLVYGSVTDAVDERVGRTCRRYGTPGATSLGVAGGRAGSARRVGLRQGTTQPVHLATAARAETPSSTTSSPAAAAAT